MRARASTARTSRAMRSARSERRLTAGRGTSPRFITCPLLLRTHPARCDLDCTAVGSLGQCSTLRPTVRGRPPLPKRPADPRPPPSALPALGRVPGSAAVSRHLCLSSGRSFREVEASICSCSFRSPVISPRTELEEGPAALAATASAHVPRCRPARPAAFSASRSLLCSGRRSPTLALCRERHG